MGPCSYLSSLEVTRPRSQSQQGITNTGQYICLLGISIIIHGEHTEMASYFLVSTLSLNVRFFRCQNTPSGLIFMLLAAKQDSDCPKFRKFRRQLFHTTLAKILEPLKPFMSKPEVVRCVDDHFRRVIYGIGPYIADYPEQSLLCATVQGWCPKYATFLHE